MSARAKVALTAERLREVLTYSQETGVFTWRIRRGCTAVPGATAGSGGGKRYVEIRVDGELYRAHRLAWLHVTGAWPVGEVDHRNELKADNRWDNLRDVTHQQNAENVKAARAGSETGLRGVKVSRRRGTVKFEAAIASDGTTRHLGYFATPEEAHQAYATARASLHGGFAQ